MTNKSEPKTPTSEPPPLDSTDPSEPVLVCVIGSVRLVYERADHRLIVRHVLRNPGGHVPVIGRDRPCDRKRALQCPSSRSARRQIATPRVDVN